MDKTVVLEIANMEGRYGIENYLMNMLRNFDFEKVKIHFMSVTPGPFDEEIKSYGGDIYRVAPLGASFKKVRRHNQEFRKLLTEHPEIQVVHIHGNTAIGCIDARIANKMGVKKVIVHSHNDGCNNIRSYILHLIGRLIIGKSATTRVACSEAAARWMFGKSKESLVLKNAIDVEKYKFTNKKAVELKRELGIENKKTIGHIGRMEKQKNHSFILDVFYRIHKEHPETCLMLIGDGSLRQEITQKAREMGLEDAIIFIRQSDRVNEMLQAMDIFLFPSIWEGLGISLVEAQASGLNCVVSDIIKDEVCVTELIEKHSLSEGAEKWANVLWSILEANQNKERSSEKYIKELRKAGYDERDAARYLQEIYIN